MYKTNYLQVLKVLAFMSWNLNVQQILFYHGREGKGRDLYFLVDFFLKERWNRQHMHSFQSKLQCSYYPCKAEKDQFLLLEFKFIFLRRTLTHPVQVNMLCLGNAIDNSRKFLNTYKTEQDRALDKSKCYTISSEALEVRLYGMCLYA